MGGQGRKCSWGEAAGEGSKAPQGCLGAESTPTRGWRCQTVGATRRPLCGATKYRWRRRRMTRLRRRSGAARGTSRRGTPGAEMPGRRACPPFSEQCNLASLLVHKVPSSGCALLAELHLGSRRENNSRSPSPAFKDRILTRRTGAVGGPRGSRRHPCGNPRRPSMGHTRRPPCPSPVQGAHTPMLKHARPCSFAEVVDKRSVYGRWQRFAWPCERGWCLNSSSLPRVSVLCPDPWCTLGACDGPPAFQAGDKPKTSSQSLPRPVSLTQTLTI